MFSRARTIDQNQAQTNASSLELYRHNTGFGVSTKYKAINTAEQVDQFLAAGFEIASISRAGTRIADKRAFAKHLVRLRPMNYSAKIPGLIPEVIVRNSFDGNSAYRIMLGIYRLVCSNGLMVGKTYQEYRIRHVGDANLQVIEAAHNILRQSEMVFAQIEAWNSLRLNEVQKLVFARDAALLVAPDSAINIEYADLLTPRRDVDTANDLFTVMNVVQENLMRGDNGRRIRYQTVRQNGTVANNTVRSIRSIDRNIGVNQALWDLTTDFAKKLTA